MALRINSENRNLKRKIELSVIDRIAKKTLKKLGTSDAGLDIIFVSDQKIRAFNRKYLGKNKATDVLAFPGEDKTSGRSGNARFLGDIAISTDRAFYNAADYGTAFKEEVALYVIHGILHLLGYDDTTAAKRKKMRKKENELLQEVRKSL